VLLDNGYEAIGFDHFSLPTDDLFIAEQSKTLLRNFMGYTTQAGREMIAVGFSSISDVSNGYAQNTKNYPEYVDMIEKDGFAIVKGLNLSEEDVINKEAIMKFMCQYNFDPKEMSLYYDTINKSEHMNEVFQQLDHFIDINLLKKEKGLYQATELGKVFARIVASTFDTYIKNSVKINAYSKAV
jgi:oxygen-independent coproporphyrinogen-3 oxidase